MYKKIVIKNYGKGTKMDMNKAKGENKGGANLDFSAKSSWSRNYLSGALKDV